MPELAEAIAQRRVDESGEITRSGSSDIASLRDRLLAVAGDDLYSRWLKWFFADRATRTASAFTEVPMTKAVDQLLASATSAGDFEEAHRRRPTDTTIMAKLADAYRKDPEPADLANAAFLDALLAWNRESGTDKRILAAQQRMRETARDKRGFLLRDAETNPKLLDLTTSYNALLDELWHAPSSPYNFSALPRRLQSFSGVTFDIRGMIAVNSQIVRNEVPQWPERVSGIPVGQVARRIHILHATSKSQADGTRAGSYILHYRDGQTTELPIIYGEDLRDFSRAADQDRPASKNASEVWPPAESTSLTRLFLKTYENPRPDAEIATIDLVSAMDNAAPFVVAITLE